MEWTPLPTLHPSTPVENNVFRFILCIVEKHYVTEKHNSCVFRLLFLLSRQAEILSDKRQKFLSLQPIYTAQVRLPQLLRS